MTSLTDSKDRRAILSLWLGWLVSSGAITAIAVLSLWMTRIWLPIIALSLGLALYIVVRRNREAFTPMCYVVPYVCIYVMVWSGIVMTAIDIINTPRIIEHPMIDSREGTVPYLGALIVYPIAAAAYLYSAVKGYRLGYCRDCRRRFGNPSERGFLGMIFSQEGLFQRKTMAWLCCGMTITSWAYYFFDYINISLTEADIYVFFVLPAVIFIIANLCTGIRAMSIYYYYNRDFGSMLPNTNGTTTVRYIIICGNEIYLHIPDPKSETVIGDEKIDTPLKLRFPFRHNVSIQDARTWAMNFLQTPRASDIDIRFMYSNTSANAESNMFHYLVFAKSRDAIENSAIKGCEWFTIYDIDRMLKKHMCNLLFGAEIVRLHTIAMAWKTYDREGRRLYKIKNYTPTFRLCDIPKWDVDYNDSHWLYVAENNEDKPFYRWNKFWRRYISGIND